MKRIHILDCLFFTGCTSAIVGLYMAWPPLAPIAAGFGLAWVAWRVRP